MRVRLSRATVFDLRSESILSDGVRLLIAGESGSGKSNAAALIMEQVIAAGGQVVLLDPHAEYGNLWGVDPARVVRVGYGGISVSQESTEECVDIVRKGQSLLLDLSHWMLEPRDLSTFVLAFVKGVYKLRVDEPQFTLLVIEEAQLFIPQLQMSGQAENVQVFIGVMTGGRKFGLETMLLTQRASLVDSNAIGSCNIRIFLRTSEVRDWKRIRQYIPESLGLTYDDMKNLRSGEAVVLTRWSPEARVKLLRPNVQLRKATL